MDDATYARIVAELKERKSAGRRTPYHAEARELAELQGRMHQIDAEQFANGLTCYLGGDFIHATLGEPYEALAPRAKAIETHVQALPPRLVSQELSLAVHAAWRRLTRWEGKAKGGYQMPPLPPDEIEAGLADLMAAVLVAEAGLADS